MINAAKRRLITSALPYVNNVPHLGNLIQGLSADVFARFCRLSEYETLYICGTDEYGTATETRARSEGITPQQLCDRYYKIHDDIYRWFQFSFDRFGRTSDPKHTAITQAIFKAIDSHAYIVEETTEQLYSEKSALFLADRYIVGICPKCNYHKARGDQCENCGSLLDPADLIEPKSVLDGSVPVRRETRHLYIDLPALLPKLEQWLQSSYAQTRWTDNAMQMTKAWMRDGLRKRAITRDLKWGIAVPKKTYENKVFYVWFDAPIGYISITAQLTNDWERWWKNPENVNLYQFVGKDNIPFHTVIFPCTLLGSNEKWTLLHHISSTEYLNYEGAQFSKSSGIGIFGDDAMNSGIPADMWRFYMLYNRPEKSDFTFTWEDFFTRINKELIGNFANLFNRLLRFIDKFYDGKFPTPKEPSIDTLNNDTIAKATRIASQHMHTLIAKVETHLEMIEIRSALRCVLALADIGNKLFQESEPWKTITQKPQVTAQLIAFLSELAKNLTILIEPFLPQTAERCRALLNIQGALRWEDVKVPFQATHINKQFTLFQRLEWKEIQILKARFSGATDSTRHTNDATIQKNEKERVDKKEQFNKNIHLIAAKITAVTPHPNADTLFVEEIDDGSGKQRQIVSGLAEHYTPEALCGKTIILVANLKPIKLRGEVSNGMLLAAEDDTTIEVLETDAPPGTRVVLKDVAYQPQQELSPISANSFFKIPITVRDNRVTVAGHPLVCNKKALTTRTIKNGTVS